MFINPSNICLTISYADILYGGRQADEPKVIHMWSVRTELIHSIEK
jgi:hypothetical protein